MANSTPHVSTPQRPRITNGYVFRTVFGDDPEMCAELIRTCLDINVSELVFVQPERVVEATDSNRAGRLDLYVVDTDGNRYDIEIQERFREDEWLRARHYQSLMDATFLKKGGKVRDLPRSLVLFICDFDPLGKGLKRYDCRTCCLQTGEEINDRRALVLLNAKGEKGVVSPSLNAFLQYVAGKEVCGDPFVDRINQVIDRRVCDQRWMEAYMTFQDELDAERYYGEQLGREKERKRFQAELAEERRVNAELARALNEAGRDGELTGAFLDDNKRAELIREFGLSQG